MAAVGLGVSAATLPASARKRKHKSKNTFGCTRQLQLHRIVWRQCPVSQPAVRRRRRFRLHQQGQADLCDAGQSMRAVPDQRRLRGCFWFGRAMHQEMPNLRGRRRSANSLHRAAHRGVSARNQADATVARHSHETRRPDCGGRCVVCALQRIGKDRGVDRMEPGTGAPDKAALALQTKRTPSSASGRQRSRRRGSRVTMVTMWRRLRRQTPAFSR